MQRFLIIIAVSILLIVVYSEIFYPNNDFMRETLQIKLNLWHISHFGLYTLLGYLYPGKWLWALALGIAWELFEMSTQHIFQTKYWYGDAKDVIFNMMGYALGEKLSKHI